MNKKRVLWMGLLVLAGLLAGCQCSGSGVEEGMGEGGPEVAGVDWTNYVPRPYDDGAELIDIPGGTYTMGSSLDSAPENETPAHAVSVPGFQIYSHEVTNEMYWACVERGVCMYPGLAGTEAMKQFADEAYADYPVNGVDWHMARDYCEFVGGRLPTEAEWELAARGLDSFTYPWGESLPTCDLLNMKACITPEHSVPGGSYPDGKSPYGLYDMSGNVWEWVNDWYAEDGYATAGSYGPNEGEEKVLRGGGYLARPESVTTTVRQFASPDRAFDDVGFRCVKNAPVVPAEIEVPPERHVPTTPDEPDDGLFSLERAGAGCQLERHFQLQYHVGFTPPLLLNSATAGVIDPATHAVTFHMCTFEMFDADTYLVLCNADLPASIVDDHPPTFIEYELTLNFEGLGHLVTIYGAVEVVPCLGPGGSTSAGYSPNLSCPDSAGITTLTVTHGFSPAPDFINYAFDGWDMSTCSTFYADTFTCTGILTPMPLHPMQSWYSYPGDPVVHSMASDVPSPAGCEPTGEAAWRGEVFCNDTGGYSIALATDTIFAHGVSFASGGGGLFECTQLDVTHWTCIYNPPDPPEPEATVQICPNLTDGTPGSCATYTFPFPAEPCGTTEEGEWRITETGCLDETRIYFILDTDMAWLIPGAGWTYTAGDGENPYSCNVDPVVPGRLNCEGNRPAAPGTMAIAIQQDGAPSPTWKYFDTWPAMVAAIPDCIITDGEVLLTSYGCDPATGNFFAILEVSLPGVTFDEYQVTNGVFPCWCDLISTPPDRIYCYSDWDPTISWLFFMETDPVVSSPVSWMIAPEPCPAEEPDIPPLHCSDFHDESTCNAHHSDMGCYWDKISTCIGP